MRVLIACSALLVLAASAHAQAPVPQLLVEDVHGDARPLVPGDTFRVGADVVLTCPHAGYVPLQEWIIDLKVDGSAPGLLFEGRQSAVVPQDYCIHGVVPEGWDDTFHVDVRIPTKFDAFGVHEIRLNFRADNGREVTHEASGLLAFEVVDPSEFQANDTKVELRHEREEAATLGEEAPGPALPLLGAALLALARRQH